MLPGMVTDSIQLDQHPSKTRNWLVVFHFESRAAPWTASPIQCDYFFKARPRNDSLHLLGGFPRLINGTGNPRFAYFFRADLATRGFAISFLTPAIVALADLLMAFFLGIRSWLPGHGSYAVQFCTI